MLLQLIVICVLLSETSAQLSRREQIACFATAQNVAQTEKDKELKKMMKKTLDVISDLAMDMMTELTDEQKDKVMKSYFTGQCTQLTIQSMFSKN